MGTISLASIGRPSRPTRPRLSLAGACELLYAWAERRRQRIVLGSLDDRMLRDIGLDSGRAMEEASKPFWRV